MAVALPPLPEVSIYRAPPNPPEFMFASAWYYLPKSADVLFQHRMRAPSIAAARHVASGALGKLGLIEIAVPLWRDQS